jgi:hypothetical protein
MPEEAHTFLSNAFGALRQEQGNLSLKHKKQQEIQARSNSSAEKNRAVSKPFFRKDKNQFIFFLQIRGIDCLLGSTENVLPNELSFSSRNLLFQPFGWKSLSSGFWKDRAFDNFLITNKFR